MLVYDSWDAVLTMLYDSWMGVLNGASGAITLVLNRINQLILNLLRGEIIKFCMEGIFPILRGVKLLLIHNNLNYSVVKYFGIRQHWDAICDVDFVKIGWGIDFLFIDTDDDGLLYYYELYTYGTDPTNSDIDNDGLTDGDEVTTYDTDPIKSDTDGDGLPDGDEVNIYNTDPLRSDSDGDGFFDAEEIKVGTDPLDARDSLLIRSLFVSVFSFIVGITVVGVVVKRRRNRFLNELSSRPYEV